MKVLYVVLICFIIGMAVAHLENSVGSEREARQFGGGFGRGGFGGGGFGRGGFGGGGFGRGGFGGGSYGGFGGYGGYGGYGGFGRGRINYGG